MTHVTCRLTAKNQDQLRNPMLGNRVWATFTFLKYFCKHSVESENHVGYSGSVDDVMMMGCRQVDVVNVFTRWRQG